MDPKTFGILATGASSTVPFSVALLADREVAAARVERQGRDASRPGLLPGQRTHLQLHLELARAHRGSDPLRPCRRACDSRLCKADAPSGSGSALFSTYPGSLHSKGQSSTAE
jgi:hypothetical protein